MNDAARTETRTLLILGAGRGQLAAIDTARAIGLEVVAIDPNPAAIGLARAHHAHVADLADLERVLRIAREHRIDGVMTLAADYPMPVLGAVCEQLGLPGPSPDAVLKAVNKRVMRAALADAGVACPRSIAADDAVQAAQAVAAIGADCIFKPAMSHGGRGITRLPRNATTAQIESAFRRAHAETRADGVLVEEFVEGPEFSVEAITWRGQTTVVAVTDKMTNGAPYYVEVGHNQPSRWPADQVAMLRESARLAVRALGIDNAPSHTELRLSAQGPCIMELAARLGGGFINSHLVPLSSGVDIVRAAIAIALGDAPELTPGKEQGAAIRFVEASPGTVTAIDGLEAAAASPGVVCAEIYLAVGDCVAPLVDARSRAGHVIATGVDAATAGALAEAAQRRLAVATRRPQH